MLRLALLRFFESYFRHRWLYLLPIVLMMAAGGVYIALQPPVYSTSGKIYVEGGSLLSSLTSTSAIDSAWWMTPAQATINEINELLTTEAFVRSVIQKSDLEAGMSDGPAAVAESINAVRRSIWILPRGEQLIEIGAGTGDPQLSQQLVSALMNAYVQWKLNSDYQESVAAQYFFQNLINPYQEELEKARNELTEFLEEYPEPVRGDRMPDEVIELERLTQAVNQAEARLRSAMENEESARLQIIKSESVTRQTYLVIDEATLPTEPNTSRRGMARDMAIFLAIGVFLSLVWIGAGALLDRTLRFPVDVRFGLHLPVLTMIPTASIDKGQLAVLTEQKEALPGRSVVATTDPTLQL